MLNFSTLGWFKFMVFDLAIFGKKLHPICLYILVRRYKEMGSGENNIISAAPMSAIGTKRTFCIAAPMSAFGGKADMATQTAWSLKAEAGRSREEPSTNVVQGSLARSV